MWITHLSIAGYNIPPVSSNDGYIEHPKRNEIWVSSNANVESLGRELFDMLEEFDYVDLACIGAGAVNAAMKAVASARKLLPNKNAGLMVTPFFSNIYLDSDRKKERTRLMLRIARTTQLKMPA